MFRYGHGEDPTTESREQVWQLIILQGVGVGIGGGLLYYPVIKLLPEWFSARRGFAGGIIFAGTGVGGRTIYVSVR